MSALNHSGTGVTPRRQTYVALLIMAAVLACPGLLAAQRHGGGSSGGSSMWSYSRPDGVADKDTLQDFHHVLEVQATASQIADFQALIKTTDSAKSALQSLLKSDTAAAPTLTQALDATRTGTKTFISRFSEPQKSGLKDQTKRLEKADSDLAQAQARLLQSVESKAPDLAIHAQVLDKTLSDFAAEQLALGREMSIVFASGQDRTFNLPIIHAPVNVAGRKLAVIVSSALSQVSSQEGQRTFQVEVYEDQSDLQTTIDPLSRALLDSTNNCGERIAVRRAMLMPAPPAATLVLQLHYERWTCSRMLGSSGATELAESDGTVEVKLTPVVDKSNILKLTANFGRMDATGMFADALKSGDLGDDLRDKISRSLLPLLQIGTNFNANLPSALQNSVALQSVHFRDAGAGVLALVLDGQTQMSNQQADALAAQLNQSLGQKAESTR
jgi:hypothetical protein